MDLYEQIIHQEAKVAVIGLGYVGMPLAIAFAKKQVKVIGYDVDQEKIALYQAGVDPTDEVGNEEISQTTVDFTSDISKLEQASFYIVTVPTPVNMDKKPNLTPVKKASQMIGSYLKKGAVVVYESTVYPGVTEDICIPILEAESGLSCGRDFKVGYSPERINPGDKVHRLENIIKIVSGVDQASLEEIAKVYELIIEVGVHRAESIKVAEAAKVVENSQRDINIAFMNELAMVFEKMNINTKEVITAMNTKWNALKFYPGLVGGHCIGVDPYYFVYEAERLGYHSQIITAGRKINDGMGAFIADALIKELVLTNKVVKQAKVVIMGVTFKENCADIRNSKVEDIIARLREYGIEPIIVDPWADPMEVKEMYQLDLPHMNEVTDADCLAFAVAHDEFCDLDWGALDRLFGQVPLEERIIIDVKSIYQQQEMERMGYRYWNL
ncbi:nucleotide sugar dehydrogenase [Gracilibacillus alcaliphilus]|uniref:nucleotide sugar dehydrogenase n=1 Tax=Gracilibacillus alcaliphilus TaxID=1401441 RepID=UPI00195A6084|nr:nucleotide sugar dehydrogenase [Gracilibacillus alcaliphilus]